VQYFGIGAVPSSIVGGTTGCILGAFVGAEVGKNIYAAAMNENNKKENEEAKHQ
jgi:hypothetical protein